MYYLVLTCELLNTLCHKRHLHFTIDSYTRLCQQNKPVTSAQLPQHKILFQFALISSRQICYQNSFQLKCRDFISRVILLLMSKSKLAVTINAKERDRGQLVCYPLCAKSNSIFQPLEVVSRYHEPQHKVGDNYPYLSNLRPNICKSWCLNPHFVPNNYDLIG